MQRRTFLRNSIGLAALGAAGLPSSLTAAGVMGRRGKREFYELRVYRLAAGGSAQPVHSFLHASIPALNKLGASQVGVFTEIEPKNPESVFVLASYPSLEAYGRTAEWLRTNKDVQEKAGGYLQTTKDKPGFDRIDSWLLLAFAGMPRMEIPSFSRDKKSRLFELRTYESYSEVKAARKIDMFNDGEIQIMRDVGLSPIFYGEALIGPNLPHLTYMTSGEDEQSHKKHWDAFGKHPLWDKMKNDPKYADTVSKITKWMLKPTEYSQI